MSKYTTGLVFSLLGCGLIAELAGFLNLLYPVVSFFLVLPIFFLILTIKHILSKFLGLTLIERFLILTLVGIWLLHSIQIWVPETGFDAVWYHLPIVARFTVAHRIFYIPEFYQSLNPLLADLVFLLGFQLAGETGVKLIAYLFGVSLILVSYQLSCQFLSRRWSLITVIVISTFQVVTWQSASFYVDLAKAVWEITSLYFLLTSSNHRSIIISSIMFGASLATKLFSLLLYPAMLVLVVLSTQFKKIISVGQFLVGSLMVVAPFYVYTYLNSGNPFLSLTLHTQTPRVNFWLSQLIKLPLSLFELTLANDYVTGIFLCLLPVLVYWLIKVKPVRSTQILLIFSLWQCLLWWFIPPTSTRYAISGFVTLLILYFQGINWFVHIHQQYIRPIYLSILILTVVVLVPRLVVAQRSLTYLFGKQTKEQYLHQFYDGWINEPLRQWHQL